MKVGRFQINRVPGYIMLVYRFVAAFIHIGRYIPAKFIIGTKQLYIFFVIETQNEGFVSAWKGHSPQRLVPLRFVSET